jgi:hypothetical protein
MEEERSEPAGRSGSGRGLCGETVRAYCDQEIEANCDDNNKRRGV